MKRIMVRYKVKADRAAENEQFIREVFAELKADGPAGLRYAPFKLDDGVSFVHIASVETDDGANRLSQTAAFRSFQENIRDRCEEPPIAVELHQVGAYRLFVDE